MAHLITLHTAGQNQEILFNLDTMVSAEKNDNYTAINTRWGYQNVRESLEEIMEKSIIPKVVAAGKERLAKSSALSLAATELVEMPTGESAEEADFNFSDMKLNLNTLMIGLVAWTGFVALMLSFLKGSCDIIAIDCIVDESMFLLHDML